MSRMRVFVPDNYDWCPCDLVQYLGTLGAEPVVQRNDEITPARPPSAVSCSGSASATRRSERRSGDASSGPTA
jgi:hypothetical protein